MNEVSRNIKRIRTERGIKQEELAEKLHVTRQAVSNWEREKTEPDLEMLQQIASALDTDIPELIYGKKTDSYKRLQMRYWIGAGIAAILTAVFLYAVIRKPYVHAYYMQTFRVAHYLLYASLVRPALSISAAVLSMNILCLFFPIHPKTRTRWILGILGGLLLILMLPMYALLVNLIRTSSAEGPIFGIYSDLIFIYPMVGRIFLSGLPILAGICLFLSMNPERKEK